MFDWNATLGLIGVVIGGLITFLSERSFRNRQITQERRTVALAFAAEIEGWLEIMKIRNHAEKLSAIATQIEREETTTIPLVRDPTLPILSEFLILNSQLPHIGQLGEVSGDLSKFYNLVAAVQTTLKSASAGAYNERSPAEKAGLIRSELQLWNEALDLGRRLIPRLRSVR